MNHADVVLLGTLQLLSTIHWPTQRSLSSGGHSNKCTNGSSHHSPLVRIDAAAQTWNGTAKTLEDAVDAVPEHGRNLKVSSYKCRSHGDFTTGDSNNVTDATDRLTAVAHESPISASMLRQPRNARLVFPRLFIIRFIGSDSQLTLSFSPHSQCPFNSTGYQGSRPYRLARWYHPGPRRVHGRDPPIDQP